MSDNPPGTSAPAANTAASAASNATAGAASGAAAPPKKPLPEGNPAFRMMGLPRMRLPSRNWLIFLSLTGSFASAVIYDKWQTKRNREKWCNLVSNIADETVSSKTMPRKMTIYLAAPPGDGLKAAREHFHEYIKPILVAAAMDWDVVEGRKEGDVRYKTAERVRRKRKRAGEGTPLTPEEETAADLVEAMREKSGVHDEAGVAGDLVVGRHTWKEYMRGLHEGWLGPVDARPAPVVEPSGNDESSTSSIVSETLSDAAAKTAAGTVALSPDVASSGSTDSILETAESIAAKAEKPSTENKEEKKEEVPPKPRNPLPYIEPSQYESASLSTHTPSLIGPSIGIQFPHILGFRNTPIRIYRFLNRRTLADDIGRQVASAVLASYRPYETATQPNDASASGSAANIPEQATVLANEERNWWKTTFQPRKEFEESVWIEDMVLDERITSRMQTFQITAQDEDRAKRVAAGTETIGRKSSDDS
ncbi:Hypothetical protein R9X50_00255000 [Acrodontium crateriforme]|uniref:Mitochondrial import inner membrane translocase subunit TIM54 n=1 Tax=Acrodontium crateriforme TaxID=150365 RepID=A0AAQ3M769_9PEZI|nr:Hypothetical protein R9X50_00255000 [Acrodontium crateriforme]